MSPKQSKAVFAVLLISVLVNISFIVNRLIKKGILKEKTSVLTPSEFRKKTFATFPVHSTDTVFLGDSQTEYFPLSEIFPTHEFVNRGICSESTAQLLSRVDEVVKSNPRLVLIQIGINDFRGASTTTPENAADNVSKIIQRFQSNTSSAIVLESIFPNNYDAEPSKVVAYNSLLKKLAKEKNVRFLDLYPHFKNEKQGLLQAVDKGDHVHLSPTGYKLWAAIILANI